MGKQQVSLAQSSPEGRGEKRTEGIRGAEPPQEKPLERSSWPLGTLVEQFWWLHRWLAVTFLFRLILGVSCEPNHSNQEVFVVSSFVECWIEAR